MLVPSATMAEHVRNELAREGFVLRKGTVTTLTRFVEDLGLSWSGPDAATLERVVGDVLRDGCPAEYQVVADRIGFHRHVAGACDALSLAGVRPSQLEGALGVVYGRVLRGLKERQVSLRGDRLRQAREGLSVEKLRGVKRVLLDGSFGFANREIEFLNALSTLVPVAVTVAAGKAEEALRRPEVELVSCDDVAHEALVVAERIVRLVEQGVDLRRIGVMLRNANAYAPLVEATLGRLGIASRSYLGTPLESHPVVGFYRAFVAAAENEWENGALLNAMRWGLTGLGGASPGDSLEFAVRAALPSNSLELFGIVQSFAAWSDSLYVPALAAEELKRLAGLIREPSEVAPSLEEAWRWHQQGEALAMLFEAIDASVVQFDEPVSIGEFWRVVNSNLAGMTLFERDLRRNVVHVMDLFESRQWDLDYVFAMGLAEGEFPQRIQPDPLLTEALKKAFGMKTMDERLREELFLYEMLLTRANVRLVMTYPRMNAKGDPVESSPLVGMQAVRAPEVAVGTRMPVELSGGALGGSYREKRAWSASEFEMYLSCPWKHFAARGLKLVGLPETPAERLNPMLLGNAAHEAITQWTRNPERDMEAVAEKELVRACREARVPPGYQYERERINLLRNLRSYAKHAPPVPPGWQVHLKERFETTLPEGVAVRGEIDRYDQGPGGEIHAYDFKYSKATGLEEKYPIQGALYAIALGDSVERFSFIALREQSREAMLTGEALRGSIELARQMMTNIVEDVGQGKIEVLPRVPENCGYCAYLDACRVRTKTVAAEEAETA